MADTDHTARKRRAEPFWIVNEQHLTLDPDDAKHHTRLMRVAGTSLAMCVIRHVLSHSERLPGPHIAPIQTASGPWLFTPTQLEGLRAALYFLRRHGEGLLHAEQSG